jgi:hypothetical protein
MWSITYHLFMAAILLFQLIMIGILGSHLASIRPTLLPTHETLTHTPLTRIMMIVVTTCAGLSQYGGGITLVILPFITAFLWFGIHRQWDHTTKWGMPPPPAFVCLTRNHATRVVSCVMCLTQGLLSPGPLEGTDVIKPQSWEEFVGTCTG